MVYCTGPMLHFTLNSVVISLKTNAYSVFALQECLHATSVHVALHLHNNRVTAKDADMENVISCDVTTEV